MTTLFFHFWGGLGTAVTTVHATAGILRIEPRTEGVLVISPRTEGILKIE